MARALGECDDARVGASAVALRAHARQAERAMCAAARGCRAGGERTLEGERADSEGESHGLFDCGCGCKRGRDGSRVIQMRRGKLRGKHANSGPHHRGDLRDAEGLSARGSRCMLGRRTPLFFSKLCLLTKYTHASVTVSEKSHPSASAPVPRRTPTPHTSYLLLHHSAATARVDLRLD